MSRKTEILNGFDRETLNGLNIVVACHCGDECDDEDCAFCAECAEFSSNSCEICDSRLAGERHALAGVEDGEVKFTYSVCTDCFFFCANGDLPDEEEEDSP